MGGADSPRRCWTEEVLNWGGAEMRRCWWYEEVLNWGGALWTRVSCHLSCRLDFHNRSWCPILQFPWKRDVCLRSASTWSCWPAWTRSSCVSSCGSYVPTGMRDESWLIFTGQTGIEALWPCCPNPSSLLSITSGNVFTSVCVTSGSFLWKYCENRARLFFVNHFKTFLIDNRLEW